MHVIAVNGSPRAAKFSNTDKILTAFLAGAEERGATAERFAVAERGSWDAIRAAWTQNEEILIALPLFVECVPGLLLEFFGTLPAKDEKTRVSFILQSGFAEGCQLRCGEAFLEKLCKELGVTYGGTLVKGDNFGIRLSEGAEREKQTAPYRRMGALYAKGNGFRFEEAAAFTGPEVFPLPVRLLLSFVFKTFAPKRFQKAAAAWGCTEPLDDRPWERG